MKPKEARCRYNAARSQYMIFKPSCVFVEKVLGSMVLPPHIDFFRRDMEPNTCRYCKAFKEDMT